MEGSGRPTSPSKLLLITYEKLFLALVVFGAVLLGNLFVQPMIARSARYEERRIEALTGLWAAIQKARLEVDIGFSAKDPKKVNAALASAVASLCENGACLGFQRTDEFMRALVEPLGGGVRGMDPKEMAQCRKALQDVLAALEAELHP